MQSNPRMEQVRLGGCRLTADAPPGVLHVPLPPPLLAAFSPDRPAGTYAADLAAPAERALAEALVQVRAPPSIILLLVVCSHPLPSFSPPTVLLSLVAHAPPVHAPLPFRPAGPRGHSPPAWGNLRSGRLRRRW